MRLLLDTHTFLWFCAGSERLSERARKEIESPYNQSLLSKISLWEIAIKSSIGKLSLSLPFAELIPQQLQRNSVEVLDIEQSHLNALVKLPFHHRDPFDRLLIAQAVIEQLPVVSVDAQFDAYPIQRLWA